MLAAAFLLGSLASVVAGEERTWTSQTGSQFVGFLQEERPDAVVIANAAGQKIIVPLTQLSAADRQFLREVKQERHQEVLAFYRAGRFDDLDLPEKAEIKGIRHVVQRESFCVPASAEMLLRFHGFSYDQDYLAKVTSRNSARSAGTNFGDLMKALRNVGVDSVGIMEGSGSDAALVQKAMNGTRAAIAAGYPVLISYETSSSGHAVVATAYDDRRRAFWVMDPAATSSPQRLDYKVLKTILTGAVVVIPPPNDAVETLAENSPERDALLSKLSRHLRSANPAALQSLVQQLQAEGFNARLRNANRPDLGSFQGQTRSFARQEGVEFIRLALQRGLVIVAPQTFEDGPGVILLYGTTGKQFQGVEFLPDGTFRRGEIRPLDFSLRWLWREQKNYLLPLVEIDLASGM